MKTFTMLSLSLGIALFTASCNSDSGAGRSTPVESTKDSGRAPVEYNGSTETPTTDTSMIAHPAEQKQRQDNQTNSNVAPAANSNTRGASNTANTSAASNTTDSSTTSGSSTHKK